MSVSLLDLLLLCFYGLTLLSLIAVVFLERKDPQSTLVWMLILSFLPVIGVILYIFLGRGLKLLTRRRMLLRRRARESLNLLPGWAAQAVRDTLAIANGEDYPFRDEAARSHAASITLNARLADAPYTQDNGIVIYTETKAHYDAMFEEIRATRETIHLIYFIIAWDDVGRALVELLAQKAREGVKVILIYDELGSITTPRTMFRPLRQAGGEVYRFFPLNLSGVLRANYRNHHKIVVLDGKVAYMGGMNIGKNYLGLHKRIRPWRDTHMRLTGSSVDVLQSIFLADLYNATNNEKKVAELMPHISHPPEERERGEVGVQIVSSGPDLPHEAIKRGFCDLISSAKKSVLIQSPYLMPDQAMLEALQNASASGVKVKFMLPGVADKRTVYVVTNSYIGALLEYGVEVYKHEGFLHAKMLVVDDEVASIGTCNMDMRSFSLHFEVNAFLYDRAVAKQCAAIFEKDLEHCTVVTKKEYEARGLWQKLRESVLRLFAPLM